MIFVGIDPGLGGAVAVLHPDGAISLHDTPTILVKKTSGKKRHYLPAEMVGVLLLAKNRSPGWDIRVALENIAARPGQGVTSMFSMGRGLGLWEGLLAGLGIPYELVTPRVWKASFGLGKDKGESIIRAQQLFPRAEVELRRRKDDGRAEALLIAEWLRHKQQAKGAAA
jgi:crossover junction endodeoxyribonuclease RuvC